MKIRTRRRNRPAPPAFFMGMVSQSVRDNYGEPLLVSQDEVAHRLAISRTTLWRLLKGHELESISIGSRTFITKSSIDEFLARNSSLVKR